MHKLVDMRRFDYSFLKNEAVPARFVSLASDIAAMKVTASDRQNIYTEAFVELEKIAKVQSVKSSNAIEGVITNDIRINEIVNRSSAPLNHDEAEIAGYRDVLNLIHKNYKTLDLDERDILSLHKILFSYTGSDNGGKYKQNDNVIIDVDTSGNRNIRFKPISADETLSAMKQWYLAYIDAKQDLSINRLLLIPCVVFDFLCIHPFTDGNGRMSRLISLLLLYKEGYDIVKYISFEEQINKRKDLYYQSLKNSSIGWENNQNNYFPFAENFIYTLLCCYKELDMRFSVVNGKKLPKNKRIELTLKSSVTPLSKSEICDILIDVSPTTVEAVLGSLVKNGIVEKIGSSRSVKYIYKR